MERLTKWFQCEGMEHPEVFHFGHRYGKAFFPQKHEFDEYIQIIDRLAAYEDTGLEPEDVTDLMAAHGTAIGQLAEYRALGLIDHLRELVQAEKDGRLVVLPCKTVYVPTWDAGEQCDLACRVSIGGEGCCDLCDKAEQFIYEEPCRQEHIEQIGKTVFLTREEAEAALGGGDEG